MIDVKEILDKHGAYWVSKFDGKKSIDYENAKEVVKEIITEVLKEAADNAKFENKKGELLMGYSDTNGYYFIINKESITSVIDTVKF